MSIMRKAPLEIGGKRIVLLAYFFHLSRIVRPSHYPSKVGVGRLVVRVIMEGKLKEAGQLWLLRLA